MYSLGLVVPTLAVLGVAEMDVFVAMVCVNWWQRSQRKASPWKKRTT